MTKEELEKEAEEKLPQVELDYCHGFMNPCEPNELPYIELVRFRTGFERGYIAGAEPREKRIAELEAQIEEMECCGNCKHFDKLYNRCELTRFTLKSCLCNSLDKWEIKEK